MELDAPVLAAPVLAAPVLAAPVLAAPVLDVPVVAPEQGAQCGPPQSTPASRPFLAPSEQVT
ncbi:hypothetical protein [Sorangium sp. So ce887]|uniref:hypothetical protein n=1 Tax=Sorangium sp. So ce887 TaxID=3133324 RepID=UPI003F5FA169